MYVDKIFNPEAELQHIIKWTREWFANNTPGAPAVIGMSGGKDSTITAAILTIALGVENVVGILLPNGNQYDKKVAVEVCEKLKISYYEINIHDTVENIKKNLDDARFYRIATTDYNIPPRIRMTYLYAIANMVRGVVANTSNYSEAFLGYETKWGDMCGDFGLLSAYTVNEVLAIGKILVDMGYCDIKHIEKIPEDGLTHRTDENVFGFSYEELDNYIMYKETPCTEKLNNIIYMNKNSKHKRNCINIPHPAPLGVWRNNNFQTYGGIVLNI